MRNAGIQVLNVLWNCRC